LKINSVDQRLTEISISVLIIKYKIELMEVNVNILKLFHIRGIAANITLKIKPTTLTKTRTTKAPSLFCLK